MSFANLKKRSKNIDKLVKAAEAASGGNKNSYTDDRKWKPTYDKAGNGYAVVRFLPAGEGQDLPWGKYWDHGFQGPTGRWYIEKSRTSIGEADPVSELNSELWNQSTDDNSPGRKQARTQKRRLHHVANVLVVKDPENPQNEGKVFLYEFGKKIFDKIMDAMQPDFEDEDPVNPFDFWEGANFKIKIRKVDGWINYDKSEFDSPSTLADDDKLEAIYNSLHDLSEYSDPSKYKSYDELKKKLTTVLGAAAITTTAEEISLEETAPAPKAKVQEESTPWKNESSSEDDDTLSYFENLVND